MPDHTPPLSKKPTCSVDGCDRISKVKGMCSAHYNQARSGIPQRLFVRKGPIAVPVMERLWEKVNKNGPLPPDKPELGPCWLWEGAPNNKGYGVIGYGGHSGRMAFVHRLTYEEAFGNGPKGLVIDHLCRITLCCRPAHLEAVTQQINVLRGKTVVAANSQKTHCPRGHEYSGTNLIIRGGSRECRMCHNERRRVGFKLL